MLKVGVVGATGYTGEELIRILVNHKDIDVVELSAIVEKEEPISSILPYLKGRLDIMCRKPDIAKMAGNIDLAFLALPHRVSMRIAPEFIKAGKRVIDLSADYRLDPLIYEKWYGVKHNDTDNLAQAVYGLPELYRDRIKNAKLLSNPGCYPTGVILGVSPVLSKNMVDPDSIISDSKSGATGAGRKAALGLIFCEINENIKAYKINEHQHKPEINAILSKVAGRDIDAVFTPHLIPMNRGILSTIYMKLSGQMTTKEVLDIYNEFYSQAPFVRVSAEGKLPQIKDVVGTNYCDIGIKVTGKTLVVVSCIDNLKKGAAGQAVQNMNIMYGFNETEALV